MLVSPYKLQKAKRLSIDVVWIDNSTIAVHKHGSGAIKKKGLQSIGLGNKCVGTKLHLAFLGLSFAHDPNCAYNSTLECPKFVGRFRLLAIQLH